MNDRGKTLVLYPEDNSTVFLEQVIAHLFATVNTSLFEFFKIKPTEESHKLALREIEKAEHITIIFLGHGSSHALQGARNDEYKNEKFISNKDFLLFKGKRLLLVSCDSCVLIKKTRGYAFLEAIGFGDLPTDWNDIQSARELNASAYDGFTELTMQLFRKNLVEIVKYSLSDFLNGSFCLRELYDSILLRINKRIADNFINKLPDYAILNDCLLKMKYETLYVKNI
jgi:hypothetical protein